VQDGVAAGDVRADGRVAGIALDEPGQVRGGRAPAVAGAIEPTDRSRVVRALELAEIGELSDPPEENELWADDVRRPTLLFGLTMERDELYRRIDERVERMVAEGAAEEVRRAAEAGASKTARKALGFEELLSGDVEAMKRRTRNYAKRQLTWMRRLEHATLVDVGTADPVATLLRLTLEEDL
jgi:tRNA dimethylallyltransferase